MGLRDVLDISDWTIQQELYFSLVLTFLLGVLSFFFAIAWQRWKAQRKARRAPPR